MSSTQSQVVSLDVGRYFRALRQGWPWLVACTVLGGLAAGLFLSVNPGQATATTLVNINVVTSEPFNFQRNPSSLIDAQTEVQMVRSSSVVSRSAEELGAAYTPTDVRNALAASVEANATVVRVNYTATDPIDAITGADTVAEQYITYRGELAGAKVDNVADELAKRRDVIRDDLLRVDAVLASAKEDTTKFLQATNERELLTTELDTVLQRLSALNGIDTSGGTILTSAVDMGAFVQPSRATVIGTGLIVGFLVGLVVAYLRVVNSRRIASGFDLEEAGAGPVLAEIDADQAAFTVGGSHSDGVRIARERVLATLPRDRQTLALVELAPMASASSLPVGVAIADYERGHTVELLITDPRAELFERIAEGLDAKQIHESGESVRYQSTRYPGLFVTRVGRAETPGDSANELRRFLLEEERDIQTTIIAVTASSERSVRLAAGRLADSTILMVSGRHSTKEGLAEVLTDLQAVGASIAGSIMIGASGPSGVPVGPGTQTAPPTPVSQAAGSDAAESEAAETDVVEGQEVTVDGLDLAETDAETEEPQVEGAQPEESDPPQDAAADDGSVLDPSPEEESVEEAAEQAKTKGSPAATGKAPARTAAARPARTKRVAANSRKRPGGAIRTAPVNGVSVDGQEPVNAEHTEEAELGHEQQAVGS